MLRRSVFKLAAGAALLAAPRIALAQRARVLKFVPLNAVTVLDPVWSGNRFTHGHGYLVFDTLYGLDERFTPQPQMVEGHTVENDGTLWTLRLREGLRFHDDTPVLARDAVASIRRWSARDGFGQSLMAATGELSAPDDRTIRFRLTKPFPHLPTALAGQASTMPCIMPERLANTDPFRQVTEMVGSGPYRFVASEFVVGERSTYQRFTGYVPRGEGTQSYTAGPKIAHFDRVEWMLVGDPATAVAALQQGEIDWLESPTADQAPLLAGNAAVTVEVNEPSGSIGIMRFNHLHPPFNNPAIRRALLGAVDQADVMTVVAGADRALWHDRVGLFAPGSPLANDAGIEVLSGPRDYGKVKHDLEAAGYRGERVVVVATAVGAGYIAILAQVGVDQLRKAGMEVDLQLTDFATLLRRIASQEPPDKGGWNIHFNIIDGIYNFNPAGNTAIRGDGKSGMPGWPNSPKLEALRDAWLATADLDGEERISREMQLQLWQDVPYIPLGHWVRSTAHRREIVDLPRGFPAFYGVRRA
ncbi:MAG TPA: ABC transporter substrate-binding protein [Stellaceae bacterium]